jgi:hypothetical protein
MPRADVDAIDAVCREKRPLRLGLRGVLPRGSDKAWDSSVVSYLFRDAGNELARLNEPKGRGVVTALEIDRLVLGAVDMNHLTWV